MEQKLNSVTCDAGPKGEVHGGTEYFKTLIIKEVISGNTFGGAMASTWI